MVTKYKWSILALLMIGMIPGVMVFAEDPQSPTGNEVAAPERPSNRGDQPPQEAARVEVEVSSKPLPAGQNPNPLGMSMQPISPALAAQLQDVLPRPFGVVIEQIQLDSAAAKAGLQAYDVLVEINGQPVWSPERVLELTEPAKVNDEAEWKLIRRAKLTTLKIAPANADEESPTQPAAERIVISHSLSMPAGNAAIGSVDGRTFQVELSFVDDGRQQVLRLTGTPADIADGLKNVPAPLGAAVMQRLQNPPRLRRGWIDWDRRWDDPTRNDRRHPSPAPQHPNK